MSELWIPPQENLAAVRGAEGTGRMFVCYRQSDVARFIDQMDAVGAILAGVSRTKLVYVISYYHSEPIDMEVKT